MPTYNGWPVITMPDTPWPARLEFATNHILAVSTNPFTGQQQTFDYNSDYMEGSIAMPNMQQEVAAPWITFLKALKGTLGVFQFPAGLAAQYPESFTSDGTAQRYWRLKTNQGRWSIKIGSVYMITFEIREAT